MKVPSKVYFSVEVIIKTPHILIIWQISPKFKQDIIFFIQFLGRGWTGEGVDHQERHEQHDGCTRPSDSHFSPRRFFILHQVHSCISSARQQQKFNKFSPSLSRFPSSHPPVTPGPFHVSHEPLLLLPHATRSSRFDTKGGNRYSGSPRSFSTDALFSSRSKSRVRRDVKVRPPPPTRFTFPRPPRGLSGCCPK